MIETLRTGFGSAFAVGWAELGRRKAIAPARTIRVERPPRIGRSMRRE
jgi:hypothetical protein